MAYTYIQAIGDGFPKVHCHAIGDGTIYSNIVWDSGDPLPTQATLDSYIFSQLQVSQCAIIDAAYYNAMQLPVAYIGTTFQADLNSQSTLNKAIVSLQGLVANGGSLPANFGWSDSMNVMVPMTLVQLQGLAASMLAPAWAAFSHQQTQKAAIRAATTASQVLAIVW